MDPRDRADAVLARAQARDGVVTPDNMTSPMDAANTQQIPRSVMDRIDADPDPDSTTKLPSSVIEANDVRAGGAGTGGAGDSHLTEPMSTAPLPQPSAEQIAGREPTQQTQAPRPTVQQAPSPAQQAQTAPLRRTGEPGQSPSQAQAEQPSGAENPVGDAGGAEPDGLVPTVRTHAEQSYVSRRLEGL